MLCTRVGVSKKRGNDVIACDVPFNLLRVKGATRKVGRRGGSTLMIRTATTKVVVGKMKPEHLKIGDGFCLGPISLQQSRYDDYLFVIAESAAVDPSSLQQDPLGRMVKRDARFHNDLAP
ncbi:hypothetical protein HAX54_027379 [Datura stramonium]|uniref:Uncharacterized protein n=1 Tax=Datura stramonium TaxID=4076 RepID=A0ABS8S8N2_DATST|nr:hypothetical protein [Datura stramonium]